MAGVFQKIEYRMTEGKRTSQQLYVEDTKGNKGQWYLSLIDTVSPPGSSVKRWVLQPEQYGSNKFSIFQFEPSQPGDVPIAMVQSENFDPKKGPWDEICMAVSMHKEPVATCWPMFFKTWTPIDARHFIIKYNPWSSSGQFNGLLALESAWYRGFYLAVNWNDERNIWKKGRKQYYTPVILAQARDIDNPEISIDRVMLKVQFPPTSAL